MSKKKDNKTNSDFDLDSALDGFDFDFDFDEPKVKDDRKPIVRALEGARAGAKEAVKSSEFIKNAIKDTLPDGFGQTVDFSDRTAQSLKSLYDESVKDIKPALKSFKASASKLVPEDTKVLPRGLKDMFDRWRKEAEDEQRGQASFGRESAMAQVMRETFEAQAKVTQQQAAAQASAENLKDGVSEIRFKSLMEAVGTAATSIVRIDQYNTGINFKYQQRSLELQYRQLFAVQDTLKFMAEDARRRDSLLAAIAKNTMLPEFVKIKDSEARMQIAKTKLFESVIGGMYGKRNQYIEQAIGGVKSKVLEHAKGIAAGLREGAFQMDMTGGMADMPGLDPAELAGTFAGGEGTKWLGHIAGKWLNKKLVGSRLDNRFGISKAGTQLERKLSGLPNALNEFRQNPNYQWDNSMKGSFFALLQSLLPTMGADVNTTRLTGKDMDKPHFFTRRTDRSINEVIPGYLARIFRELQVLRTGNDSLGLTKFDHDSGDFVGAKELRKRISSSIVDPSRQAALKRRLDDMLKMVDPKGTLSPEAKAALMAKLVENSANVLQGNEARLATPEAYGKASSSVQSELSNHMQGFFSGASDVQRLAFEKTHNELASNLGDPRQYIQQQLDLGNQSELVRLGLIDKQTGRINLDKIQSQYLAFPESFAPQTARRSTGAEAFDRLAKGATDRVRAAATQAKDYVKGKASNVIYTAKDIFIEGEEYPRIKSVLLEAGKYRTAISNKVVTTIAELTEPIKDENGNIIVDDKELAKLVFYNAKDKVPTKLADVVSGIKENVSASPTLQNLNGAASNAFAAASASFKKALTSDPISAGDEPADVFVEGEEQPRLTAVKMKLGHYFSKIGNKPILKPSDIDGPVVGKDLQTLIDEDEVSKLSILNKYLGALSPLRLGAGILRTIGKGLWRFQTQTAPRMAANNLKFLFKRIFGPIARLTGKLGWGAIKGTARLFGLMPNQDLYSKMTGNVALSGKLLDAKQYVSERTGNTINSLKDIDGPVRTRAGQVVLTLEEFKMGVLTQDGREATLGKLKEAGQGVMSSVRGMWSRATAGATGAYQKASTSMEDLADKKLKNLTPETMRGKIKGTYGQLRKRFGFSREEAEGMETRSLLGQIKDALTPKKKRANSFEEMSEKGLGNKSNGKEGLTAKKSAMNAASGGSIASLFGLDKIADLLSGGKALFDGAKDGAGMLGTALKWGGSLLGGGAAAEAAAATGAAATGVVGAGTTAAATGGIMSAIGGGLLAAGSATLAFLSSPVVLGAATLALAAYGGYKAYKHFTRDSLTALGKLRMVQYGYKTADNDHFVNAIDLERELNSAIVFDKGNRAAINYDKFKMSNLMGHFGLDFSNEDHREIFNLWFKKRFEPVFLNHVTALKNINDTQDLATVSDLKGEKKQKYLDAVKFPEGPYSFNTMPYPPSVKIEASSSSDVQAAAAAVIEEMKKDSQKKTSMMAMVPVRGAAAAAAASASKASDAKKDTAQALAAKAAQASNSATLTPAVAASPDAESKTAPKSGGGTANDPVFNSANGTYSTGQLKLADGPLADGRGASPFLRYVTGVSMDGVNQQLRTQFYGAVEEYGRITGKSVTVNSGFRTFAEQARERREKGSMAAMPGTSMHEYGLALDVDSKTLDQMDKLGLLRKYGLTRPVGGEPWHLEAIGTQGNIAKYKTDAEAATQAIASGIGKGGGGLGTVSSAPNNTRSIDHSNSIMAANTDPTKIDKTADTPQQITKIGSTDRMGAIGFQARQPQTVKTPGYVSPNQYGQMAQQAAINNSHYASQVGTTDSEMSPSSTSSNPLREIENDPMMKVPDPKGDGYDGLKDTIVAASKLVGVDENLMLKTAAIESDFSSGAGTSTSSAKGLYQFTSGTWKDMIKNHGKKYGFDENTTQSDPKASAILAAQYYKDNIKAISGSTKRTIGVTEAYLAHLLGPGGAKKFFAALDSNPNAIAAQVLPDAANANASIFYNGGQARTIGQVYQEITNRINAKARKYGLPDSGTDGVMMASAASRQTLGFNPRSANQPTFQNADLVTKRPARMVAPMLPPSGFPSSMGAAYGSSASEQQMQSSASAPAAGYTPPADLMSKSVDIQSRILEVVSGMYELMKGNAADSDSSDDDTPAQTTSTYTPPKPMVDMNRSSMTA